MLVMLSLPTSSVLPYPPNSKPFLSLGDKQTKNKTNKQKDKETHTQNSTEIKKIGNHNISK